MKNFFFGIPALALLLVGCDGGAADPNDVEPNKPDATVTVQPDAMAAPSIPSSYPAPSPGSMGFHCPIPASTLFPSIPTAPRHMYRRLINPEQFSCSASGSAGPTDCKSPANAFALTRSDPGCCVNTYPVPASVGGDLKSAASAYLLTPSLVCVSTTTDPSLGLSGHSSTEFLGQVALCSSDGKFIGWDCNI